MGYPQKLLPKKKYTFINRHIDYLNKLYLVRHIPSNAKKPNPSISISELGRTAQLPQYSLNLLGIFKVKHSKIRIDPKVTGKYSDYWSSGDIAARPRWNEIRLDSDRGAIFFKFSIVNDYPYSTCLGSTKYQFTLCLRHKPTKCNFWHFEIKWFDVINKKEVEVEKNSKGQLKIRNVPKSISTLMRTLYTQIGDKEKPKKIPKLPVRFYK